MAKCSKIDIFHFLSDVPCSALNGSRVRINAEVFHVHHYSRILTKFSLTQFRGSNRHVKGSADVWNPAGASYLCWLEYVDMQLIGDRFQGAHTLGAIVICFPDQLKEIIDIIY